jgi:DNA-directed RNA polymerase specialized sigma24 family protein
MQGDSVNDDLLRSTQFTTTCWTVVVAAGQEDSPAARRAVESLYQRYWSPLYFYLRRRGHDRPQAEDLVQGFFMHLLEGHGLQTVKPRKHKFRSFLLASLKNFVVDEWRRTQRERSGGGKPTLPLEFEQAETRYCLEPADRLSADKLFAQSWAMAIIAHASEMIRREYVDAGKGELFDQLKNHITIEPSAGCYRQCAESLGMSEGAVRVAAHRLRRRLRELIRSEIAETVTTAEQLEEEIQDLFAAFEP